MQGAPVADRSTDLESLLAGGPVADGPESFGADMDEAHRVLLDGGASAERKEACLRQWASRHQPCLFGRLGARGLRGIQYDCCWIQGEDLARGRSHLGAKIQHARQAWKARAAEGLSHGLLVMFNAPALTRVPPGPTLVALCRALCDLYLIEHAPVQTDTIYSELIPFVNAQGDSICLKGGMNVFYSSAHRTRNHDRRVPGGIMISVNSPGLLAHSLVKRGLAADLTAAVAAVRTLAWASIGHGGMSRAAPHARSCSWHNEGAADPAGGCPMRHRPKHVPEHFSTDTYSALYHTDVLVPGNVMSDGSLDGSRSDYAVWSQLDFRYLTAAPLAADHENFGFVQGQHVRAEAGPRHAWAPQPAPLPSVKESRS
jgi:hypothetical protein